jgi:UDP-glucose-4-epimerase GalE
MRILVTGGAGYVGSHAAKLLAERGHEPWILDNLAEGHQPAVGRLPFIAADLMDRERTAASLAEHRIEAVMHFAALAYVGVSVTDPGSYYQNNVVGSLSLLDAMRDVNVRLIVFSSSCATYGIPKHVPITEDHPQDPISPYGYTKLVVERILADYAHAYGFRYAALRYFNAAGAAADGTLGEDHDPETHLIPLVLQAALGQRKSVDIFGTDYPTPDGSCIRDYIHVDDLAAAHLLALEKLAKGKDGMALKLNLGTGRGASVKEVIEHCREITGRPIAVREVGRRPGDPPELVADASLARRELGWQPRFTDIRDVIQSAWNWHQAHPRGYGG